MQWYGKNIKSTRKYFLFSYMYNWSKITLNSQKITQKENSCLWKYWELLVIITVGFFWFGHISIVEDKLISCNSIASDWPYECFSKPAEKKGNFLGLHLSIIKNDTFSYRSPFRNEWINIQVVKYLAHNYDNVLVIILASILVLLSNGLYLSTISLIMNPTWVLGKNTITFAGDLLTLPKDISISKREAYWNFGNCNEQSVLC